MSSIVDTPLLWSPPFDPPVGQAEFQMAFCYIPVLKGYTIIRPTRSKMHRRFWTPIMSRVLATKEEMRWQYLRGNGKFFKYTCSGAAHHLFSYLYPLSFLLHSGSVLVLMSNSVYSIDSSESSAGELWIHIYREVI